jgi:membrane protein DedA with SNARE-associated domain
VLLVVAALIGIPPDAGYPIVFVLIALETMGIPLPGETALIAAALFANKGHLSIELLIVLAATAAILGDNVGFMIGRRWGRKLIERPGWGYRQRMRLLEVGEPFFERHGPKAVFLGRWVSGLRIASAWLAGINGMHWPTFLFWNALGGICWATSVGLGAYYAGHAFERIVQGAGLAAAIAVAAALGGWLIWRHLRRRRVSSAPPCPSSQD